MFFKVLAYTGMRIGELCALTWDDVDFVNNEINITKIYYNPANTPTAYTLVSPKTKAGVRVIDISKELAQNLKDHKLSQHFTECKCPTWHQKGFLFTHLDYPGYPKYPKLMRIQQKKFIYILLKHRKKETAQKFENLMSGLL